MNCSIVIPVYFNQGALSPTMDSLVSEVLEKNPHRSFEVIFVDDGSQDRSFEELLSIRERYPQWVKLIKLTRNFGQGNAVLAGLDRSRDAAIVVISADGQDPPALINDILAAHDEGTEIVVAAREQRDESWFRRSTSRLFYGMMKRLCFEGMPQGGFDFFLLSRRTLEVITRNRESHFFFQGQLLWTGHSMKVLGYTRRNRLTGKSRYNFARKLTVLFDGLLSYSYFPIRLMSAVGALIALGGLFYALLIFVGYFIHGNPVTGWAPIMIVMLVISGFQLFMLGILGEYLWRTLAQVRHREPYLIEAIYE